MTNVPQQPAFNQYLLQAASLARFHGIFDTITLIVRIGIYDPYLDDIGGGEKYMLKIAECLSSDNDVTVFWNNKEDVDKAIHRFGLNLSSVKISANIFSPKVSFLKKLSETKKYDALIILSDGSIPFLLSKKTFLHVQRPIENIGGGLKNKFKLSRISKIFCNSYYTKSFVDKELKSNAIVVYPPVDLKPKKVKKENIILHVGRFRVVDKTVGVRDYKKQGIMIEAFKKLSNKIKGWRFVMAVGVREEDENDFSELLDKAKSAPIEFAVNKSNDELWEYYSKAKIYWHASGFSEDLEKNPEAAEHFGISTVEAMGAGAVPVVINAGGQKEIVEDNISGFLWNSIEEMEEKTLLLSKENVILEKMSKEAVARAKNFAGERFGDDVKRLIENG